MEELLKSLGIDETAGAEEIVGKLELKQSEIMERLDDVEDETRKQELKGDLKKIEAAIAAFSWMGGKEQTGIARDEEVVSEDFSDLKGQSVEERTEEITHQNVEWQSAYSQRQMGDTYYYGKAGVPQDYAKAAEWYQKAAEQGDADAQYTLGNMYSSGLGVKKDNAKAVKWYRKAALQGNEAAVSNILSLGETLEERKEDKAAKKLYEEALARLETPDHEKGVEMMRNLAENGYADAQYRLGYMYANGEGIAEDKGTAAEWYRKAADQGNIDAQYEMGNIYANQSEAPNDGKTDEWYQKAAEQGNAYAQSKMFNVYYRAKDHGNGNKGLEWNDMCRQQARMWYGRAAERGLADAQYELAKMCVDEGYRQLRFNAKEQANAFLQSAEKWYQRAAEQYQEAAEQGDANAQYKLAEMYSWGRGVAQDKAKAVEWYQKAAEQGNALAQWQMGYSYYNGEGVVRDHAKAAEWYQKAAEQGEENAMMSLRDMYYYGEGVAKDRAKAAEWYQKITKQSFKDKIRYRDNVKRKKKFKKMLPLLAGVIIVILVLYMVLR